MHVVVSCPECGSQSKVPQARVKATGIRYRCPSCQRLVQVPASAAMPERRTGAKPGIQAVRLDTDVNHAAATTVPPELPAVTQQGASRLGVLRIVAGEDIGKELILEGEVVVGRSLEADLVVRDYAVSRKHFRIRRAPDGVLLEDLGSGNGTWVDGNRVQRVALAAGSKIHVGTTALEFVPSSAEGAEESTKTKMDAVPAELLDDEDDDIGFIEPESAPIKLLPMAALVEDELDLDLVPDGARVLPAKPVPPKTEQPTNPNAKARSTLPHAAESKGQRRPPDKEVVIAEFGNLQLTNKRIRQRRGDVLKAAMLGAVDGVQVGPAGRREWLILGGAAAFLGTLWMAAGSGIGPLVVGLAAGGGLGGLWFTTRKQMLTIHAGGLVMREPVPGSRLSDAQSFADAIQVTRIQLDR